MPSNVTHLGDRRRPYRVGWAAVAGRDGFVTVLGGEPVSMGRPGGAGA
jgi:hypothetical protein